MKGNGKTDNSLQVHVQEVKDGKRRYENAFTGVSRMILEGGFKKTKILGQTTYDFNIFREGRKHLVGLFHEINAFVSYVKDAADGGSSSEMAFVLIGEPGNGKTFFVEFLCDKYRQFLKKQENRKYSVRFTGLKEIGSYGVINNVIESQTFEDPMLFAMNLFEDVDENKEYLCKQFCFSEQVVEGFYEDNYRPLGACSGYILGQIRQHADYDIEKILPFIEVFPVPIQPSLGTITGKYSARDKITSSAVDLLGEEDIARMLQVKDNNNPYRINVRRGALARVGGGGIHFADEIFKNKKDLIQVYLGVIQNRTIEMDGYKWPIDTLIIATSNNEEFNDFQGEHAEAPIIDRCRIEYVDHNTNYRLQTSLTGYTIGTKKRKTINGDDLHQDPNLIYAASVAAVLTRLPRSDKLEPIEMMKLATGEVAGEKSIKTLAEVIETLSQNPDITKRFGQKGLGQRNVGRTIQLIIESPESNEGKCLFAYDIFKHMKRIVLDYISDASDRDKFLEDLKIAKTLYREHIESEMFNAFMDDPKAIRTDVLNYVNMIIGIDAEDLGIDKMWKYKDPQTGEIKVIKIDEKFINSVEERMGLKNREQKNTFRTTIRKIYGQKVITEPSYNFMDNQSLVKAVTDFRLKSDIAGAGSLVGALANRTNEYNRKLYARMMDTMFDKLDYCRTCAQKTIEYYCTKDDE